MSVDHTFTLTTSKALVTIREEGKAPATAWDTEYRISCACGWAEKALDKATVGERWLRHARR